MLDKIAQTLTSLRERSPLVHNITNHVVMNSTANALLAIGASPAMVHAPDEVEDFVSISGALVINIGTLSSSWVAAMKLAVDRATKNAVPWVLDPVGVGATSLRNRVSAELIERRPTAVRCNASEMLALAGVSGTTKGVDSTESSDAALDAARRIARDYDTICCVSGAVDFITDGERTVSVENGDPMMPKVTGLGCTATALVGAFSAVEPDRLLATVAGLTTLGIAGELASRDARGPGSLQVGIIDALHNLREEDIREQGRVR